MKLILFLFILLLFTSGLTPVSFREKQMNFTRVREAYSEKKKVVDKVLAANSIYNDSLRIYLRAFKTEKKLELWAKNSADSLFKLTKTFPICEISGEIGPKRRSHDLQVPEGFYKITEMNPYSKYYLSMRINYPNASDSIRGVKGRLGNLIYIHGGCESSGCISISDASVKELYVYIIEAYNSGQDEIKLTIFPSILTTESFSKLAKQYSKDKDKLSLWSDLKRCYDLFEKQNSPPNVSFLPDGTHDLK